MSDPLDPEPGLRQVATRGALLVSLITKYLSTLPHPIEVLEELVAVVSVTSSLLHTLDATIGRFHQTTKLCPKTSFLNPLCRDVLLAFNQFGQKVSEAQRFKVFEPNDVGLVRVPLNGWIFIMGGEAKMVQLRSRLYVEKYRVRVLIDAVAWLGLRDLGPLGRTAEQEREVEVLKKMLPLLAERLTGVWRDYKLRIGDGSVGEEKSAPTVQQVVEPKKEPVIFVQEIQDDLKKDSRLSSGKCGLHASPSTTSIASSCSTTSTTSMTIIDDSIQERWVLRRSEAKRTLRKQSYILGIPFCKLYNHIAEYYYVKALTSHPSEIEDVMRQQARKGSCNFHKEILELPEDAQKEIQKLVERRQSASSNESVKRSFEVIAFDARPRRGISPLTVEGAGAGKKKWWSRNKKQTPMEWVLVLRGETIDHLPRTTPVKTGDPWNPKPKKSGLVVGESAVPHVLPPTFHAAATAGAPRQSVARPVVAAAAPGAHVLRHVEQRRGMGYEEAEVRMEEILAGLIKYEKECKSDDGNKTARESCMKNLINTSSM